MSYKKLDQMLNIERPAIEDIDMQQDEQDDFDDPYDSYDEEREEEYEEDERVIDREESGNIEEESGKEVFNANDIPDDEERSVLDLPISRELAELIENPITIEENKEEFKEYKTDKDAEITEQVDNHVKRTGRVVKALVDAFTATVEATQALPGAHELQSLAKVLDSANNALKLKNSINQATKERHFKVNLEDRKSKKPSKPTNVVIAQNYTNMPSRSDIINGGRVNASKIKNEISSARESMNMNGDIDAEEN